MRYLAAVLLLLVGIQAAFAGEPYSCNMGALTEEELADYQELAMTENAASLTCAG
jgi:hypothetical protein